MDKQRKKMSKMSLTGLILTFITPLSFILMILLVPNDSRNKSSVIALWCLVCFLANYASRVFSIIGLIICNVKKKSGIASSVFGIVLSLLGMLFVFIVFCAAFLHESPPRPAPTY